MPMTIPAAVTTRLNAVKNLGDSATGFVTNLLASLEDLLGAANLFGTAAVKDAGTLAGDLPVLDAQAKLPVGAVPDLDAAKLTSGKLDKARLPALGFDLFTTGTLPEARIDPAIARLASPTFTGSPKGPTPPSNASDTRLATAAFVKDLLGDYARLAGPTFTGTPSRQTALASNADGNDLATAKFVRDTIEGHVNRTAWNGNTPITGVYQNFGLHVPASELDVLNLLFEVIGGGGTPPRQFASIFYPGLFTGTETALEARYDDHRIAVRIVSLGRGGAWPNGGIRIRKADASSGSTNFNLRSILTIT